ncbi:MAG TPA: magnesium/cobalt transporter CorA [Tepidisphaeraceae bacterium]
MLRVFIKRADGSVSTDSSTAALTEAVKDCHSVFWLDMAKPTDEEYALLDEVFGFHPLAIEDSINYSQRPKIESYQHLGDVCQQGYFYMVFHGPDLETFKEHLRTKEIDIFMSERYLVTIHEDDFKTIEEIMQRASVDARVVLDPGIDMLLHNLIDHITDAYMPILDYLGDQLDDLEDRALHDPRPAVLTEISARKRDLLDLRRIVGPQREVLAILTRGEVPFIRMEARAYFRDVQDHLVRTVETVELYRDLVLGARDIYLSSISNNLNQIMKTLTIISVIALPMTVVTSFYGMNFEDLPGIHTWWGFLIAMGFILGLEVFLIWFFLKKKWI